MRNTAIALCLTIAALPGCTPGPCEPGPDPTLQIGTGELAFEPLPDDGVLELVHGPQGGYHLLIGLRATHLDADGVLVATMSGTIGGTVKARVQPWLELACTEAGQEVADLFLIYDAQPEALDGQDSHVQVALQDVDGTVVEAEADVQIFDPLLHQ